MKMNKSFKELNRLKIDLATSKDNAHSGSAFGGNVSELLFLMERETNTDFTVESKSKFYMNNGRIIFNYPSNFHLIQAREALSDFAKLWNKSECSEEQAVDIDYLKKNYAETLEMKLFIQAIELSKETSKIIKEKYIVLKAINESFHNESDKIR